MYKYNSFSLIGSLWSNIIIKLTDVFWYCLGIMGQAISDYNNWLIQLSAIQLNGGHCFRKWRKGNTKYVWRHLGTLFHWKTHALIWQNFWLNSSFCTETGKEKWKWLIGRRQRIEKPDCIFSCCFYLQTSNTNQINNNNINNNDNKSNNRNKDLFPLFFFFDTR